MQIGECFGNQVIVSLNVHNNDIGLYIATDSQVGKEFAIKNNLLRIKDKNGKETGGYLDENKKNIKPLKLRGEISDGIFLPLESLLNFTDVSKLKIGDCVDT